ncbi:hypothetical protein GGF50DRAFT_93949 [Schizophyllum commune]
MSRLARICRLPLASATAVRSSAPRLLPPLLSAPAYAGRCLPSSFRTVHNPPSRLPCPSCGEPLPTALQACTKCWTIFPVSHDIPYHDLFGLPYEPNPFVVDTKTLRQRFREAQTNCHPDTWASKAADKKDMAQTVSAQINKAYQTLLNPLSRAEYILERNGMQVDEHDHVDDMEFIGQIMMARESIEDAQNVEEVNTAAEEAAEQISECLKNIEIQSAAQDWAGMKDSTVRLKYWEGIQRAAEQWKENHT